MSRSIFLTLATRAHKKEEVAGGGKRIHRSRKVETRGHTLDKSMMAHGMAKPPFGLTE
jgi:hypothetical protein